jgi:hypothetical protein
MHCDCCDKLLTEAEASARFVETGNFVDMCSECRSYLPAGLKWHSRADLERKDAEEEDSDTAETDLFEGEEDE